MLRTAAVGAAALILVVGTPAPRPATTTPQARAEAASVAERDVVTQLPKGFRLPSQGEPRWRPNREDAYTWELTPCITDDGEPVTDHEADRERTDFRSIRGTDREYLDYVAWQQLGLFRSAGAAQRALDELRRNLRRCTVTSWTDQYGYRNEMTWDWRRARVDSTHADFHAYGDFEAYNSDGNPSYGLGGPFVTVIRVRNAVYLHGYDGETNFSDEAALRRAARQANREVARFVPRLRRLVRPGC